MNLQNLCKQTSGPLIVLLLANPMSAQILLAQTPEGPAGAATIEQSGVLPEVMRRDLAQRDRIARIQHAKVVAGDTGVPKWLSGRTGVIVRTGSDKEMDDFLADLGPAYRAGGTEKLRVYRERHSPAANLRVFYVRQTIDGLKVLNDNMIITTEADTGEVIAVNGGFVADENLEKTPAVSSDEAKLLALAGLRIFLREQFPPVPKETDVAVEPVLGYAMDGDIGKLAWDVAYTYNAEDGIMHRNTVRIDAMTGSFIDYNPSAMQ